MPDTDSDGTVAFNGPRELTYRVVAMPADTNAAGDIFGGWLMSQIDIAGSVLAVREARGRVATVAVKELRFIAPIKVGDLVSCYSQVVSVGRTSVRVHVEAEASRQRSPHIEDQELVADAILVYVALDESGRPRPIHGESQ
ncbi:MAG: acyl-CoA thioesterase [Gammaproteobacteria bacterium]|nr:MAG: acyl-CoA thioesterase [Gammaproteobacteria bacterium]